MLFEGLLGGVGGLGMWQQQSMMQTELLEPGRVVLVPVAFNGSSERSFLLPGGSAEAAASSWPNSYCPTIVLARTGPISARLNHANYHDKIMIKIR